MKNTKRCFVKNNEVIKMEDSQKNTKIQNQNKKKKRKTRLNRKKVKIRRKSLSKKDILSNAE